MKRTKSAVAAILLTAMPLLHGQSAPSKAVNADVLGKDLQARGKQIVDDAIKALGGEKFLAVKDRVETGRAYSFFNENLSGLSPAKFYTRYITVDNPAETLAQQERQGLGKDEVYYNTLREEGAWETTYRGSKKLDKDVIARHHDTVLHNFFYILRNRLHEPGLIFESRGGEVVDNVPVNVVDIIDSKNRVVTVSFHQTTKLPIKQVMVWRDATRERIEEVTRFSRFRDVSGTMWPFQTHRERNGSKTYEMFAESVVINQNLPDELFVIPDPTTTAAPPPKPKKK